MERYLLFIRDTGRNDGTDIHPSETAARTALAAYVRARSPTWNQTTPLYDEDAIEAYFARDEADYVIARVTKPSRRSDRRP